MTVAVPFLGPVQNHYFGATDTHPRFWFLDEVKIAKAYAVIIGKYHQ